MNNENRIAYIVFVQNTGVSIKKFLSGKDTNIKYPIKVLSSLAQLTNGKSMEIINFYKNKKIFNIMVSPYSNDRYKIVCKKLSNCLPDSSIYFLNFYDIGVKISHIVKLLKTIKLGKTNQCLFDSCNIFFLNDKKMIANNEEFKDFYNGLTPNRTKEVDAYIKQHILYCTRKLSDNFVISTPFSVKQQRIEKISKHKKSIYDGCKKKILYHYRLNKSLSEIIKIIDRGSKNGLSYYIRFKMSPRPRASKTFAVKKKSLLANP